MKKKGPKVKLSRKLGIPLTPKAPRAMSQKPSPPAQHDRRQHFGRIRSRNTSAS